MITTRGTLMIMPTIIGTMIMTTRVEAATSTAINNLRAAFVHVVADAAVSVLVIVGLVAGRPFGWVWMDPLMGLVATVVILSWSWTLVQSAGAVLLDVCPDPVLARKIASRLEAKR
jgi:Co/Zn/Cd efflux system component